MPKGKRHDSDQRRLFAERRNAGDTLAEAAVAAGIPDGTAGRWDRLRKSGELVESDEQEHTVAGLLDEIAALRRRLSRKDLDFERVLAAVDSAMVEVKATRLIRKPVAPPKVSGHPSPEIAFLCISDSQIGQLVRSQETWGLNAYSLDVFRERLRRLVARTISILAMQRRAHPIDELCVLFLGDIVEGEGIYPGQANHLDADLAQQAIIAADDFAWALATLAQHAPQVRVYAVAGNHGRIGRKGDAAGNIDLLCYQIIQRLTAGSGVDNVWYAEPDRSAICFQRPEGQIHVIAHGDNVRGYNSIPFYGIDRVARGTANLARTHIDAFWLGHHHAAVAIPGPTDRIVNGSFVGTNAFSMHQLAAGDIPRQWLIGWGAEGRTWSYDIKLADWATLAPDEDGIMRGVERRAEA